MNNSVSERLSFFFREIGNSIFTGSKEVWESLIALVYFGDILGPSIS